MELSGSANAVSHPPAPRVQQSSIRSFFRPRTPTYTAPPTAPGAQTNSPALPQPTQLPPILSPTIPPLSTNDSTVPPQASISTIDSHHIQPLRRINSLLLPIHYPDSFYHKILDVSTTPNFSRVINWRDPSTSESKVIGGIVCRLDCALALDSTTQNPKVIEGSFDIYIQSLALLSPYREKGLAAAALKNVIEAAIEEKSMKIRGLYAHVWTDNEEALSWYINRGFKKREPVISGYYQRLNPDTAWILERRLVPSDHIHSSQASTKPAIASTAEITPAATAMLSHPPVTARPPQPSHARSFQERGPDREWNDLPEDVFVSSKLKPPGANDSSESSRSSSRSGTGTKKKKERTYPAAAFGS